MRTEFDGDFILLTSDKYVQILCQSNIGLESVNWNYTQIVITLTVGTFNKFLTIFTLTVIKS